MKEAQPTALAEPGRERESFEYKIQLVKLEAEALRSKKEFMKLEFESLERKIKMEAEALKQKAEAEAEALVQKARAEQALKQEAFEQEVRLKQQSARVDQAIKDDAFAAKRDRKYELLDLATRMTEISQPLDSGNTRNVQTHNVFKVDNVIIMIPK